MRPEEAVYHKSGSADRGGEQAELDDGLIRKASRDSRFLRLPLAFYRQSFHLEAVGKPASTFPLEN